MFFFLIIGSINIYKKVERDEFCSTSLEEEKKENLSFYLYRWQ